MAKLIDKEPAYEGEKYVWNSFFENLPSDWVVYNNRSINGREYDFCVIAPDIGLFIIEVKGWYPNNILTVVDSNTIFLSGKEYPENSPRSQARGYRFDLLKKIQRVLGINPLVMSLVCYPRISEIEYNKSGLNIISEENETIFEEDLNDSYKLYQKFFSRYSIDKGAKHDILDAKKLAIIRHFFEPNYDLKQEQQVLNPGYSRLRAFKDVLDKEKAKEIIDEYIKGIKEIVFVSSHDELMLIFDVLYNKLNEKRIKPEKGNLVVGEYIRPNYLGDSFNIFNFEIEVCKNLTSIIDNNILIEEGSMSSDEKNVLLSLSECTSFNFQQYEIEHAPTTSNILVTAGAGTGKTYSMVSRVAYLCNKTADAVVDISGEIAMITFTNDAAENMNSRIKKMFMNYFILTSNEKYIHLIEEMNKIHISTIHKFAISLLQNDCLRLGLGYDSQITNETFNRRLLYHTYLNEYLINKTENDPDFVNQLIMPTYQLEDLLLSFCDKLYDRSIDIKELTINDFGEPVQSMPYFNELIENVIIKSELEYSNQLKQNNLISLRECMITINKLVNTSKQLKQNHNFKYVFIDEFQDTDDVQIDTITGLQKLFGNDCRLFIVGDLKQSIYRFRGASLSAFDKISTVKGIGEWSEYTLNRNYRTDYRLLDKFHNIFTNLGEKDLLPYEESKDRLKSRIIKEFDQTQLIQKIDIQNDESEDLYDILFKEIIDQKEKIEEICELNNLSTEEKTIAILVRYNWQITNIVREAQKKGINIKVTEGGDLYRLKSTMDLYKLVMAITHPRDKVYLSNLIKSSYVSIKLNLADISGYSDEDKINEIIHVLDEYFMLHIGKNWNQLVEDFETRPVLVVLRDIYEATKPWIRCYEDDEKKEYRENYECLIEKITRKFSREYLTINKIYDFLKINITTFQEEESRKKTNESNEIKIICTTIHKSKGLEYGTVILPFTNEDISNINIGRMNVSILNGKVSYSISVDKKSSDFSSLFNEKDEIKEKMKEESRVLYVALTRAIRNVVWFKNADFTTNSWGQYMEVNDTCQ